MTFLRCSSFNIFPVLKSYSWGGFSFVRKENCMEPVGAGNESTAYTHVCVTLKTGVKT